MDVFENETFLIFREHQMFVKQGDVPSGHLHAFFNKYHHYKHRRFDLKIFFKIDVLFDLIMKRIVSTSRKVHFEHIIEDKYILN